MGEKDVAGREEENKRGREMDNEIGIEIKTTQIDIIFIYPPPHPSMG